MDTQELTSIWFEKGKLSAIRKIREEKRCGLAEARSFLKEEVPPPNVSKDTMQYKERVLKAIYDEEFGTALIELIRMLKEGDMDEVSRKKTVILKNFLKDFLDDLDSHPSENEEFNLDLEGFREEVEFKGGE